MVGIAATMNLEIEQLDVKTTFLHGALEEAIYMQQPEGFVQKGKENMVCQLKKSWYGLKQAPYQWYLRTSNPLCWNMDSIKHKLIIVCLLNLKV